MHNNDLRSEWAFYGRKLDTIGHLYLRSTKLPARNPDTLFFLMYTCRLLVEKKLTISGANFIRNNLEHSRECWYEILNWEERRVFTMPCCVVPYRGYARSCFSSSILFKQKPVFRSGRMGFGFFSNGKYFDFCAGGSVFGLIETIYKIHSKEPKEGDPDCRRRVGAQQEKLLDELFEACAYLRRIDLGPELNRGNWNSVALGIYQAVTGDTYPSMTDAQRAGLQQMIGRIRSARAAAAGKTNAEASKTGSAGEEAQPAGV